MLFAELRRDPILAVDANPDLGDLKDKLADEKAPGMAVDDLACWLDGHPGATPAELAARLGVGPHGLRFIPTPRPPTATRERMIAAADFDLYQQLITRNRSGSWQPAWPTTGAHWADVPPVPDAPHQALCALGRPNRQPA